MAVPGPIWTEREETLSQKTTKVAVMARLEPGKVNLTHQKKERSSILDRLVHIYFRSSEVEANKNGGNEDKDS